MTMTIDTTQETPPQDIDYPKGVKLLEKYRNMQNMAAEKGGADFSDTTLISVGKQVQEGYEADASSRTEWLDRYNKAIDAAMQKKTIKDYPIDNASNVKYPMIASASQQFAARAYGAIIKGKDVVKGKVLVEDPNNQYQEVADKVGAHMSNQLLEEMPGWVDGLDMTLAQLPNVGSVFKKTYFSTVKRINISEYLTAKEVVIKYDAKSMEEAPRITHPQCFTRNEIMSFIRSGMWREDAELIFAGDEKEIKDEYEYLEQHCWYDFDDDGYKEPYIVTTEKENGKVVRIVARYDIGGIELNKKDEVIRIKAVEYFTRYIFLQAPDGGIYGMGFGTLLGPINDAVDTILNQLIDAGTLHNTGGGFISSRIKLGKKRQPTIPFKPNEFKSIETTGSIRDGIFMLPTKEPSMVLFQLLGLIIEAGKELSSVTNLMTGESRGANESPSTVLALIEQGTMVFTAIYKRIYRSLKEEFKKIYRLNELYLNDDYATDNQIATQEDYRNASVNIVPIADPTDATNMQRIAKAQALMAFKGQGYNDKEIDRRNLIAMDIEDIDSIIPKEEAPNPAAIMAEEKHKLEVAKLNLETDTKKLERQKFEFTMFQEKIKTQETLSKIILNLATAESKEAGTQLEQYKAQAETLFRELEVMNGNQQGAMGTVQGQQGSEMDAIGMQQGGQRGTEPVL